MIHCVYCNEKQARIGKKEGFFANVFCSMRCALKEALQRRIDLHFCHTCRDWDIHCIHGE
jgi:hypothetical protein